MHRHSWRRVVQTLLSEWRDEWLLVWLQACDLCLWALRGLACLCPSCGVAISSLVNYVLVRDSHAHKYASIEVVPVFLLSCFQGTVT